MAVRPAAPRPTSACSVTVEGARIRGASLLEPILPGTRGFIDALAGAGTCPTGLMVMPPGLGFIASAVGDVIAGILSSADAGIGIMCDPTGFAPVNIAPGTAVTAPGVLRLTGLAGGLIGRSAMFCTYGELARRQ